MSWKSQLTAGRLTMALAAAVAFLSAGVRASSTEAQRSPNIVLILADDLGYGDVRVYNPQSRIATPNIDRLARQGMRFTDAHSAATCVPSRYELLTGRHKFRTHRQDTEALIEPGRLTLASLLKRAGYATAMVGKWHLGFGGLGVHRIGVDAQGVDFAKPLRGGPVDHGFDSYFGMYASLDVAPYFYIENDRAVEAPTEAIKEHHTPGVRSIQGEFWRGGAMAPGFRHEEVLPRFADRAVRYLENRARSRQPFFLYLALTAPHPPWLPAERFRGQSGAGMYGDFVVQVDEVVGRVVAALDKAGQASSTLIVFTSDNGPTWYQTDVQKYGHRAVGNLRGMKGDPWEGGHRVPFIARWPGQIASDTSSAQLVSLADMLATFAGLTRQKLPQGAGEDSFDALPVLLGQSAKPIRDAIVHEALGPGGELLAIRQREWKLIPSPCGLSEFDGGCSQTPQPGEPQDQLYNLADDPSERNNLYSKNSQIVQRLTRLLEHYRLDARSRRD